MNIKRIGFDLAKQVFQLHGIDSHEQTVLKKKLKREQSSRARWDMHPVYNVVMQLKAVHNKLYQGGLYASTLICKALSGIDHHILLISVKNNLGS